MKFTKFAIVLVFFLSLTALTLTAFLATIRENEKEKRVALQTLRIELEEKIKGLEEEKSNYQKQVEALNGQLKEALELSDRGKAEIDQIRLSLEEKDKALEAKKQDIEELQRAVQIAQTRNQELEVELERFEKMYAAPAGGMETGTSGMSAPLSETFEIISTPAPASIKPLLEAKPVDQEVSDKKSELMVEKVKAEEKEIPEKTAEKPEGQSKTETAPIIPSSESLQAGRILLINRKFNFVVMNIGSKQGLKVGDQFMVAEGNQKLAKVEVEKLYDDFSAAKILEQFGEPAMLKEGNLVTRL